MAAKPAAGNAQAQPPMTENPFFTESPLPFHLPPFDRIKDSDYVPAFERGMSDQLKEVEAIAANPDKPTFDNTIVAMERSGRLLGRVNVVFSNMKDANTDDEIERIDGVMAPKLAAQNDAIYLNSALWARVKAVYDQRAALGLDPESLRLLERYHRDFVRAGALLSEADKTRMKALNAELAGLQSDLQPEHPKREERVLRRRPRPRGARRPLGRGDRGPRGPGEVGEQAGAFVIALTNTTGQPPLASLENRTLRQRIMEASLFCGATGGPTTTRRPSERIAKVRAEQAALLGYESHAAYRVEDQMAQTVGEVDKLLAQLVPPAVAKAKPRGGRHAGLGRPGSRRLQAGVVGLGFLLGKGAEGPLRLRRI